jgi:hypothetical protein
MTEGAQPNQGAQWHGADYAQIVATKGWKSADDVLKSYGDLEKHVGAPADRLIRIPDAAKIDDTFRAEVFKRIGYTPEGVPGKPEDYGLTVPEGMDGEYAKAIAAEAHRLGVPAKYLKGLAEFNNKFAADAMAKAKTDEDKAVEERHKAVEAKLKERFGDKYDATKELMTREALRIGFTAESLEALERSLALGGEGDLGLFRGVLADIAELRREAPLHKNNGGGAMTADAARQALAAKRADSAWVTKALTRGTPEAEENIRLNMLASGVQPNEDDVRRRASGLAPAGT